MNVIAQRKLIQTIPKKSRVIAICKVTGESYQGKVSSLELNDNRLLLDLEDGGQKIIDVLEFAIIIIPILQRLIRMIRNIFK